MLQKAAQQGVDVMVATPHFYATEMQIRTFLDNRQQALEALRNAPREERIRLIAGAEAAFFPGIGHAEEIGLLCIENTNLLLVEMPFRPWSQKDLREIEALLARGITPIMAHLERFWGFQKDKSLMPALFDLPVYVQMNAECLLGFWERRLPLKLFRQGQAHLLGSDAHSLNRRPPNLAEGRAVLQEKLGPEVLAKMDALGEFLLFSNK